MTTLEIISAITLCLAALVLTLIAAVIIWMISNRTGQDRFANFLFEGRAEGQPAKPSVSRLQMLIWNFVVAFGFLYILGTNSINQAINALLQPEVLVLLGISNSTYLLGKVTRQGSARPSASTPETMTPRGGQPVATGEVTPSGPGPQGTQ